MSKNSRLSIPILLLLLILFWSCQSTPEDELPSNWDSLISVFSGPTVKNQTEIWNQNERYINYSFREFPGVKNVFAQTFDSALVIKREADVAATEHEKVLLLKRANRIVARDEFYNVFISAMRVIKEMKKNIHILETDLNEYENRQKYNSVIQHSNLAISDYMSLIKSPDFTRRQDIEKDKLRQLSVAREALYRYISELRKESRAD